MWVASTYFRSMMVSLIGVPKEMLAQLTPEDEKHVDDILATLLPVKPRSKGILFDAYGAPSDIATFPFEQVRVRAYQQSCFMRKMTRCHRLEARDLWLREYQM